jgi:hypothetical protein
MSQPGISEDILEAGNASEIRPEDLGASKNWLTKLKPGLLGTGLYFLNNLDVLHAWLTPPAGYAPLGVQRNADIAIYLTWMSGYDRSWLLPNYNAPWATPADFIGPGFMPVSLLQQLFSLNPVVALQIFSLLSYIFVAYALAFAYNTFCKTRRQAMWSLLIAAACVPLSALPLLSELLRGATPYGEHAGPVQFMILSDGFFRGLVTWPFITIGTGFQVLSMTLLARYVQTSERRWLQWLTITCLLSTLLHPFEIFETLATATIVLIRLSGLTTKNLKIVGTLGVVAAVGLSPYVFQSLSSPWVHEIAAANTSSSTPAVLIGILGAPAILVIVLLFFGFPKSQSSEMLLLKTWFISTLVLFYAPGIPFTLHLLDGLFVAIGLLLYEQIQDLKGVHPSFLAQPLVRFAAMALLVFSLIPHLVFRVQAWNDGVDPKNGPFAYDSCTTFHGKCLRPTALTPIAELATIRWLRQNASPNDLVLATEDASAWIATAPVHSFASHWLFSLLWLYPNHRGVRDAFFAGGLSTGQAHELLNILGARYVVVPDGSPAGQYLEGAPQKARFGTWTIYEVPGAQLKPYHDPGIIRLGGG